MTKSLSEGPSKIWILPLAFLLVSASSPLVAQPSRQIIMQYSLSRDSAGDHVLISGSTNFPTNSVQLSADGRLKGGAMTKLELRQQPTLEPVVKEGMVVGERWTRHPLDYGAGRTLPRDLSELTLIAQTKPSNGQSAGAPAPEVVDAITLDMDFVENYFSMLDKYNESSVQLTALLARTQQSTPPPTLSANSVLALDRSIILYVSSDRPVRVKAFAYKNAAQDSSAESDEVDVITNANQKLRIDNLGPSTPYFVIIRETSQPFGKNKPAEVRVVVDSRGQPLKTLSDIPQPSVSFPGGTEPEGNRLTIFRNKQMTVPLTVRNCRRLRITLIAKNAVGGSTVVEEPKVINIPAPYDEPQSDQAGVQP